MAKKDKVSTKDIVKDDQSRRSSKFVWQPGDLVIEKAVKKPKDKIIKKDK